MITAMILGIWLLLSTERQKQPFWEASLFICIAIVITSLMAWALPEVGTAWMLSWFIRWVFVFLAFWLMDVLISGMVTGVLFALLAGVAYFFLNAEAWNLAVSWLG